MAPAAVETRWSDGELIGKQEVSKRPETRLLVVVCLSASQSACQIIFAFLKKKGLCFEEFM